MEPEYETGQPEETGGTVDTAGHEDSQTFSEESVHEGGEDGGQISFEQEAKAREMGWVPKEEFRGNPDMWRPADEYVRRGEEILPIVRSRAEKAEARIAELERKQDAKLAEIDKSYQERFERLQKMNQIALSKQREQIWRKWEDAKLRAVEDGDTDAYNRYNQEQYQALSEFEQSAAPPPVEEKKQDPDQKGAQLSPDQRQTIGSWMNRNSEWFNVDPEMTALANAHHERLIKENPNLTLEQNLSRVEQHVKKLFGKSAQQNTYDERPHAPSYAGGGRQPGSSGGRARGWNDLPPEAKSAGSKFIEQGLFGKDPKVAQKKYAEEYWSQE